ncbi:alpha/beta hydrolase [Streptomyces buecherae]|uniref:alpha/beta hydrolase n=1 Tax=Streptomyces buecherae TaxID=2763006 RepID=UPI001C26300F|nr:alpha/beta hydrolase [Streptomyces buecherae]
MSRHIRSTALTSAALMIVVGATVAGCGGGDEGASGDRRESPTATPLPRVPVDPALPKHLTGQQVRWEACAAPTVLQGGGEKPGDAWQCGTLRAPLDYAKPRGETIDLALIRKPATEADRRIGSLVFNFGGPGGSGVATLPDFAEDYARLGERYDLVSFDPRGVGESAGVTCTSDAERDASAEVDGTPDDAAELKRGLADSRAYAAACQRASGKVLAHVDTENAARDLDLMRQVLRDRKLHYFGISYGTELGGTYAHLFPKNVGRAVLDAVVDPTSDTRAGALAHARGFQRALDNYLKDCASKGAKCPVGDDPAEGRELIAALLGALDEKPLPTDDGDRVLTESQALGGIATALYSEESWKYLSLGLQEAIETERGTILLALADSMLGRDDEGRYDNGQPANSAITCRDTRQRYTPEQVRAELPAFRKVSPIFGEFMAWGMLGCTDWPVPGLREHPEVSAPGAAPILVIGTTGDPATPYEGARTMARELGEGVGVELTYRGEGHGAYNSGDDCTVRAVNDYLIDGTVPPSGTTCG